MSTHELENKVRELRQLQALIDEAQAEADAIRDAIKAHMGDSEELRAGEYRITWKAVKAARIDTTALKKALPIHPRDSDPPFLRGVTPRSCQFTRVGKNFRV